MFLSLSLKINLKKFLKTIIQYVVNIFKIEIFYLCEVFKICHVTLYSTSQFALLTFQGVFTCGLWLLSWTAQV